MLNLKILTGSVRPGRFNIQPAKWILEIAKKRENENLKFELIDIAELNLPYLDEPKSPKELNYTKPHTIAWAKTIDESDGFIFVTPEYNHGVSPALKNAIDFLWHEWNYKPISYISYGAEAGGARSVEHLRASAGETKMYDLRDNLVIVNYWENMDENGNYKFTEKQEQFANRMLDELIFWSEKMKAAREELKAKK
jgi:NAD(P)H-dependent FMN reductase